MLGGPIAQDFLKVVTQGVGRFIQFSSRISQDDLHLRYYYCTEQLRRNVEPSRYVDHPCIRHGDRHRHRHGWGGGGRGHKETKPTWVGGFIQMVQNRMNALHVPVKSLWTVLPSDMGHLEKACGRGVDVACAHRPRLVQEL
jgi:hypothetical protein